MKKTTPPRYRSKAQLLVDAAGKRVKTLFAQERYAESLAACQQLMRTHPEVSGAWSDAAACCIHLDRWQDAIRFAQTALACGEKDNLAVYDALADASGQLKQWDDVRRYGLQALNMRAQRFGGEPVIPLPAPGPMPPPPSAQTRERNVIAFSLFGGNSKYCEPAVLNAQEQPDIYPHWVCRFYVDGSVPGHVIDRLRAGGAQIVRVEDACAAMARTDVALSGAGRFASASGAVPRRRFGDFAARSPCGGAMASQRQALSHDAR